MKIITTYVAFDGTPFDTEHDCINYERVNLYENEGRYDIHLFNSNGNDVTDEKLKDIHHDCMLDVDRVEIASYNGFKFLTHIFEAADCSMYGIDYIGNYCWDYESCKWKEEGW